MHIPDNRRKRLFACVSLCAMLANAALPALAHAASPLAPNDTKTATPIKHVIIIIGENRTFDHVFGAYQPKAGQTVSNLLSKGIINADGTPGPNFKLAAQYYAQQSGTYQIAPTRKLPYKTLPPPNTNYTPTAASNTSPPPFQTPAAAAAADYGILPSDITVLTTGASGLPNQTIDTRIANVLHLPNGPFQLSPGITTNDYANSPVHRFYEMWQQTDCSAAAATAANPSGCRNDLFPWVETSNGSNVNGKPIPSPFNWESTHEGATAMGFYNVNNGDAPYLLRLAQQYTLADNYHQAFMGGTGANHIMIGYADALWYSDGKGNPAVPPANQIENPNPQAGTNNWYTEDGYAGGSYSMCADTTQPGVGPIAAYLAALPAHPKLNCDPGHYYLLNNYNPGYFGNGTVDTTDTYTIPPSAVPSIADDLMAHGVSWAYFGEGWNQYVANPQSPTNVYCNICNPFQYETAIMTNPAARANIQDTTNLYQDLQTGALPAVSYVKPGGLNDGHPESSKISIFEAFVKKILLGLQANPKLWASTAVFITVDEGGGYYDSGYIQPLDFFGDGTRIPLLVVSPYSRGGFVSHAYSDHASIIKFIEANWFLPPITARSRDNLPNPVTNTTNAYAPTNGPAISDLMPMFHFPTP